MVHLVESCRFPSGTAQRVLRRSVLCIQPLSSKKQKGVAQWERSVSPYVVLGLLVRACYLHLVSSLMLLSGVVPAFSDASERCSWDSVTLCLLCSTLYAC